MREVHVLVHPGETLLGRFEVRTVAPAQGGLVQARAWDRATGSWVQLVTLEHGARLRVGATARFRAASDAGAGPALLPREDLGEHGGTPLAVREDGARPVPAGARLRVADAWPLLCSLVPAVQVAGAALGGELDARDLVIDASGRLLLAPSGVVRADSLSSLPHHRAPEAWDGPVGPVAGALYGLGAWLFLALTGEHPVATRSLGALRDGQARPRPLATLVPDAPAELAAAIDGLLSPDPDARLRVASTLPAADPVCPVLVVPASREPLPASHETPDTTPSAAADRALRGWLVVADLRDASRTARRRLAALSEVPLAVLEDAIAAGTPVLLREGLRNEASAQDVVMRLQPAGVPVRALLAPDSPTGRRVAAVGLGGAGALGLVGSLALLPLGVPFALMAALPASFLVAGATFLAVSSQRDQRALRGLSDGASRLAAARPICAAESALAAARRAVLAQDVPAAIQVDLEAALDGLQDAFEAEPDAGTEAVEAAAGSIMAAVAPQPGVSDLETRVEAAETRARAAADALRARA